MEEFKQLLKNICSRKPVSLENQNIFNEIVVFVETREWNQTERTIVEKFIKLLFELTNERAKFFRPDKEIGLVEEWNRVWTIIRKYSTNSLDDESMRLKILRMIVFSRGKSSEIYASQGVKSPHRTTTTQSTIIEYWKNRRVPNVSINRYSNQVGFALIKAKKYLDVDGSERAREAKDVLNNLVPNEIDSSTTTNDRPIFRHRIDQSIIDLIRLIDQKAVSEFAPEIYGPSSLDFVMEKLVKDSELIVEFQRAMDESTKECVDRSIVELIVRAIVLGSKRSIGGLLMQIYGTKKQRRVIDPTLRSVEKVNSAKKRKL